MKDLKLIAAVSLDGAIGHDRELIWHIPEDLKRYKERTTGNICIVGLNTYNDLPMAALKGRTHVVVTGDTKGNTIDAPDETQPRYTLKDKNKDPDTKVWSRSTVEEMLELIEEIRGDKKVYVIGGETIYSTLIDHVDEAEITWVNKTYPKANKRFPIDKLFNDFELVGDSNYVKSEKENLLYKFSYYKRIKQ